MKKARKFGDAGNHRYARTIQAWVILVGYAHRQVTITYGDLSVLMLGKTAPRSKAMHLGQLYSYCDQGKLPHLPAIVVEKKTHKPAPDAPYIPDTVSKEIEDVYGFPWYQVMPPTEEELDNLPPVKKPV